MQPFYLQKTAQRVHLFKNGKKWGYRFEKASINGKRRRVQKSGFPTKKAAEAAGAKAYEEYITGGHHQGDGKILFADYLDIWFERTKLYLRNNTIELREKAIRIHIKPILGLIPLISIQPKEIEDFVKQKRKDGFSYNTVSRLLSCISSALDYAIYPMELLQKNPARQIKIPKNESAPAIVFREKRRRLEDQEIQQIFNWYPFGNTYHMPFMIALYFGTRLGETIALTWNDCDFANRILYIRNQIQRLNIYQKRQIHYLCAPKTKESIRPLYFDVEEMLPLLQRWQKMQKRNEWEYDDNYYYNYLIPAKDYQGRLIQQIVSLQKRCKAPGPRLNLICTHPNGKYIQQESINYHCRQIRQRGIKGFDFHTLRHTNLTILGESQIAPNDIMARAGHTNYDTTMKYYIDRRAEMQVAPVKVITKNMKHLF